MMLEDFFTLNEMRGGLTTLTRVEELISSMQKELVLDLKNTSDTARQWSTVANVLAVTTNDECLNHFIHLGGLDFLDSWLNHTSVKCMEEATLSLLGALEVMPVDTEGSSKYRIGTTVKNLLGHTSLNVQEKARRLLDSWIWVTNNDSNISSGDRNAELHDVQKIVTEDDCLRNKIIYDSSQAESSNVGRDKHIKESVENSIQNPDHSTSSISSPSESVGDLSRCKSDEITAPETSTCHEETKQLHKDVDPLDHFVSNACQSDSSLPRDIPVSVREDEDIHKYSTPSPSESVKEANVTVKITHESEKWDVSSSISENTPKPNVAITSDLGHGSGEPPAKRFPLSPNHSQSLENQIEHLKRSPSGEFISKVARREETSLGRKALKLITDLKRKDVVNKNTEIEFDYAVDALEVARQVAMEVEREVVDYREPLCSSSLESDDFCGDSIKKNIDSERGPEEFILEKSKKGDSICNEGSSSPRISGSEISNNINHGAEEQTKDSEVNNRQDQRKYDFDLNEDASSENELANQPSSLSAPIPVVAVSKGNPSLPVSSLYFDGEHGWKGSAATSAFRSTSSRNTPTSSRNTPDGEKTYSTEANSLNSMKKGCLNIDLNVSDIESKTTVGLMMMKPPSSSSPHKRENSVKARKLNFDLNSLICEDTCPYPFFDQKAEEPFSRTQIAIHSSLPSSTPSSIQVSRKKFDLNLNDSTTFFDAFGSSHSLIRDREKSSSVPEASTYNHFNLNQPFFSINGVSMDFNKADTNCNTTQSFRVNGKDPMVNLPEVGGNSGLYSASPLFPYNNLSLGPPMSFSPPPYLSALVPYTVDSKGSTFIPQILNSSGFPSSSSRQSFLMSGNGTQPGLGGIRFPSPSFDLNSGIVQNENENGEIIGFRQMFNPEHTSFTGEQTKRKEPESGWEPYNLGYKQMARWH